MPLGLCYKFGYKNVRSTNYRRLSGFPLLVRCKFMQHFEIYFRYRLGMQVIPVPAKASSLFGRKKKFSPVTLIIPRIYFKVIVRFAYKTMTHNRHIEFRPIYQFLRVKIEQFTFILINFSAFILTVVLKS